MCQAIANKEGIMKIIIYIFLILGFTSGLAFSDEEYSYEKVSENIGKITKTEMVVTPDNTTIEALDERIASIKRKMADKLTQYNEAIIQDQGDIAKLEAHKKALKMLGIKEIKAEVIE
jgi:hypothetical protein